jgi:gliding motility-associated-like protein
MLKCIHNLLNANLPALAVVLLLLMGDVAKSQCINTFPYLQDFEIDNGGWVPGGFSSDWAWGTPQKTNITAAASGVKCWLSGGLTSPVYLGGEKSYLESPCFDFSSLVHPYLEFKIFWDTERQYDGGNLQYSINNGVSWINVGSITDPVDCRNKNWYNSASIGNLSGLAFPQSGWSGNTQGNNGSCLGGGGSAKWLTASHCLTDVAGEGNVKFRFTFCSGTACNNYDGLAFDSLFIGESPIPSNDFSISCTGDLSLTVAANANDCATLYSWDFDDPGSTGNFINGFTVDHTFSAPGIYTVKATVVSPCIGINTIQKVISFPDVSLTIGQVTCNNGNDGFATASVLNFLSPTYVWLPSGNSADTLKNIPVGEYAFTVLGGADDCKKTIPFIVDYGPDAFPNPDLGSDVFICPGQTLSISPGLFSSYSWNTGESSPTINVDSAASYMVTVSNAAGCKEADTIIVEIGCGADIWVPNAFTPDEDGINDLFKAEAVDIPTFSMAVFNRLGQPIFQSDKIELGWDGKNEGVDAPIGMYGYTCRYTFRNGEKGVKRGSFLLLR